MKKLSLTSIFSLLVLMCFSQMGSLALSVGVPQNSFRENTDATGVGFDLSLAFPFQKSVPIYLGLDINYMVYGFNSENLDLSADIVAQDGTLIASLPIPLRVVNTNSIFGTHAFLRAVAPFDLIQPYAEGLVGFRYISTNTKIEDRSDELRWAEDPDESNLISRTTVLDDWIFSYGFGGGFMIKIGRNAFIDLRANYFKGQRAQYFDGTDTESWEVSITDIGDISGQDDPQIDDIGGDNLALGSRPRESTTDLLTIKVGIAFKF
ncbi:MAG: hypothetical protein AB8B73_10425 [Ekhidna sp.]